MPCIKLKPHFSTMTSPQQVEGTQVRTEYILWDNDNRSPTQQSHGGTIPREGVTDLGDVKLEFCYYTKISYCGNPG